MAKCRNRGAGAPLVPTASGGPKIEAVLTRFGAVWLVLLLTACAGAGGDGTSSPPPNGSSLRPTTRQPTMGAGESITGVLGADSIEGGCPYLKAADGTRYQVIYPKGWQVDRSSGALSNPAGEVVARAGANVTVRGEIADDMASTCQIGPIFRASEVVAVEP